MSHELERRLERLLRLPHASEDVEQRALGLALAALPSAAPGNRRLRTLLVATAAALGLLAVAAGALATVGALHVSLGTVAQHRRPAPSPAVVPQLRVPGDAAAVAAVVDGRLWLTTRSGLRIEGLPVESATLSPHALYVAAGIGDSLVAMAPNGTRAWSHAAGGRVVAIAWAPDALRIAYVVRTPRGFELRTIEGNGIHDRLVDTRVRPVAPSWRADSLSVAYVAAGGRPVLYDFAHDSHHLVGGKPARSATQLAFAPNGGRLAVTSAHGLSLVGTGRRAPIGDLSPDVAVGVGWVDGEVAVALNPPLTSLGGHAVVRFYRVGP